MQLYDDYSQDAGSASAGVCFRCRSHERHESPVLYTDMWIDAEMGRIELCKQDVMEMASLYGALAPERAEQLRKTNRSLGAQIRASLVREEAMQGEIDALRKQVAALRGSK